MMIYKTNGYDKILITLYENKGTLSNITRISKGTELGYYYTCKVIKKLQEMGLLNINTKKARKTNRISNVRIIKLTKAGEEIGKALYKSKIIIKRHITNDV